MHASSSLSVCIDTQIGLLPISLEEGVALCSVLRVPLVFALRKIFHVPPFLFPSRFLEAGKKRKEKRIAKKYSLVSLFFFSCEQRGKRGLQVFFKHISHKSKIMTHMLNRMQLQSNQSLFRRKKEDPSRRNGSISFFYPKNTMRRTRKPLKKTWKTFTKSSKKTK